jgi:hypothetical protein
MKKIILLLAIAAVAGTCWAGAYIDGVDEVLLSKPPAFVCAESDQRIDGLVNRVNAIDEQIAGLKVVKPAPKPQKGLAVGFNGQLPTLAYATRDYEVEVGYTSRAGDRSALVRAAGALGRLDGGNTVFKAGLTLYPGTNPSCGVSVGLERYLAPNVSVSADIYPVKVGGGADIIGDAVVGGRLYF